MRETRSATRNNGKIIKRGIVGGESGPIRGGARKIIPTISKNAIMEPCPQTSDPAIFNLL